MTMQTRKRIDREGPIHKAILRYLRLRLKSAVVAHVPNSLDMGGDKVSKAIAQGRAKALGMVPGFPDLVVLWRGRVLFLEVKAPGGSVSDAQKNVHSALGDQGFRVAVVRSEDDARAIVDEWADAAPVAVEMRGTIR